MLDSDLMRRAPFGATSHWLRHAPSEAVARFVLSDLSCDIEGRIALHLLNHEPSRVVACSI